MPSAEEVPALPITHVGSQFTRPGLLPKHLERRRCTPVSAQWSGASRCRIESSPTIAVTLITVSVKSSGRIVEARSTPQNERSALVAQPIDGWSTVQLATSPTD